MISCQSWPTIGNTPEKTWISSSPTTSLSCCNRQAEEKKPKSKEVAWNAQAVFLVDTRRYILEICFEWGSKYIKASSHRSYHWWSIFIGQLVEGEGRRPSVRWIRTKPHGKTWTEILAVAVVVAFVVDDVVVVVDDDDYDDDDDWWLMIDDWWWLMMMMIMMMMMLITTVTVTVTVTTMTLVLFSYGDGSSWTSQHIIYIYVYIYIIYYISI